MKLFALFTLLPAVLAFPSPAAYNPFPPPPQIASAHSNNPISHGALNDRNVLSSAHSSAQEAMVMDGQKAHMAKRTIKKLRKVKRQNASCKPRDEATATATETGTGTATATGASSSVTKSATSTGAGAGTVRPTTSPKPSASATTTTKTSAAAPAKTNFTVDPDGNGPFKGQATYYDTDVGYGSCGTWHKNWQPTVALSRELMDNWPGYNGLNPNNNPICGQRLQLNYQGKTLIAEVQDTCPSCTKRWIDVSQGIFEYFAATSVGMLGIDGYTPGFTWQWVDRNTPLTVLPH